MAERPDLIVLGGDYVTWGGIARAILRRAGGRRAAPLSAPHGVFGVIGNHDDDRDMPAALAAARRRDAEGCADAPHDSRRAPRPHRHSLLDARARDIAALARGAAHGVDLRRAHSLAPQRSGCAVASADAERAHARRADRPAGPRAVAARNFPIIVGRGRSARTRTASSAAASERSTSRSGSHCPPEVAVLTLRPISNRLNTLPI